MPTPEQPEQLKPAELELELERYIILTYRRRSRVDNDSDRFNVEGQHADIREECARRGFDKPPYVVEDYVDAKGHRSGRHEHTRPDWLKLRSRMSDPRVLMVMFPKIDRASRSVRDFADLVEECTQRNVGIVSILEGVDTLAGVGRRHLDLHLRAVIAQEESDLASERMTRRIALKRNKGIPHGAPPFGTCYAGEGEHMRRVLNEHAPKVALLMKWFAAGRSYRRCQARCHALGITHVARNGQEQPFGLAAVQTIICNVLTYAGYLHKGPHTKRGKVKLAGEGTLLERFARAVGAVPSSAIDPIISAELAEAVIARRLLRQRNGRQAQSQALLTHALWCNGRSMYSAKRDGGRYRLHGRNSRSFEIARVVFVNFWPLINTIFGCRPACWATGITASSSFIRPLRTPPTSKAMKPPGLTTRRSSSNTASIFAFQSSRCLVPLCKLDIEGQERMFWVWWIHRSTCTKMSKTAKINTRALNHA